MTSAQTGEQGAEIAPAPVQTLEIAGKRFLEHFDGSGICAADFLLLCDMHGVKLAAALRAHIESDVLRVSATSISTTKRVRGVSPSRAIKALTDKLLGIVPEDQLKLRVDMIPKPLHRHNLRTAIGKSRWSALRANLLTRREHLCEICGNRPAGTADLHAHEIWEYNLAKRPALAKLRRIGLLCHLCHSVEHLGNSLARIQEGALPESYLDTMLTHFCKVNGVGEAMWDLHSGAAWDTWQARSKRKPGNLTLANMLAW